MQFVPKEAHREQVPCIHIPLSMSGETLDNSYRTGTQQEIEEALGYWLRTTIRQLEVEKAKQVCRFASRIHGEINIPQDEQAGEKSTPVRHYDVGMVTNVVSAEHLLFHGSMVLGESELAIDQGRS
jgi:hypothetical protein